MEYHVRSIDDARRAVRSYRNEHDLDQSTLAERAGVTRQTVSAFENGKNIKSETLFDLLRGIEASITISTTTKTTQTTESFRPETETGDRPPGGTTKNESSSMGLGR